MTLVVLTNNANDPIASILKNDAHIIDLDTLLNQIDIFDKITEQQTKINWSHDNYTIQNSNETILLNRICHLGLDDVKSFASEDRLYSLIELQAYLGFAVSNFKTLNKHKSSSGTEPCLPLPNQWELIKKNTDVSVPNYYWGDPRFNHLSLEKRIFGDIYNYNQWRPNQANDEHVQFCYQRPSGSPYFVLSIGGESIITPFENNLPPPCNMLPIIAESCRQTLNLYIAESLFFIDDDSITFGFMSPLVNVSQRNADFNTFCHQTITRDHHEA
ncbi:MAG: hypothetical protein KAH18_02610 [Psychromonas sp.]|nr:hypothetical protein [Psychromonas sp.]